MKNYVLIFLIAFTAFSCKQKSLDERAEREARDYTSKYCPTPIKDFTRTDSMTFEKSTRTIHYYYSLFDQADNEEAIEQKRGELRDVLLQSLKSNTDLRIYKEEGFNFALTYHSGSQPQKIVFEARFGPKDYQ